MLKIVVKKDVPGGVNPYTATLSSGPQWIAAFAGKTRQDAWNRAVYFAKTTDYEMPPGGLKLREEGGARKRRTAKPRGRRR